MSLMAYEDNNAFGRSLNDSESDELIEAIWSNNTFSIEVDGYRLTKERIGDPALKVVLTESDNRFLRRVDKHKIKTRVAPKVVLTAYDKEFLKACGIAWKADHRG